MDVTLDLFLTGDVPKDGETSELHVIIEEKKDN
jgi:hypothetical protein